MLDSPRNQLRQNRRGNKLTLASDLHGFIEAAADGAAVFQTQVLAAPGYATRHPDLMAFLSVLIGVEDGYAVAEDPDIAEQHAYVSHEHVACFLHGGAGLSSAEDEGRRAVVDGSVRGTGRCVLVAQLQ